MALGAEASALLGDDLTILREVLLEAEHVQVGQLVQVDLVALELGEPAATLELSGTSSRSLHRKVAHNA